MGLFQKNLQINTQEMEEESESRSRRRTPSIPLVPPASNSGFRPLSRLERSLLPGIKPDMVLPAPSAATEQSETSQLTIFYAGVINVYDDVPIDKAQVVMLLAGQCSSSSSSTSSPSIVKNSTKADQVQPSLCNAKEDLPIARRRSLRSFLDKRRDRIINKSPYQVSK